MPIDQNTAKHFIVRLIKDIILEDTPEEHIWILKWFDAYGKNSCLGIQWWQKSYIHHEAFVCDDSVQIDDGLLFYYDFADPEFNPEEFVKNVMNGPS